MSFAKLTLRAVRNTLESIVTKSSKHGFALKRTDSNLRAVPVDAKHRARSCEPVNNTR